MFSTLRYGYFGMYPFYIHLSHMWLYLSGFSTPLFWHALLYISFVWVGIGWVLRQKYPPWMVWITGAVLTGIGSFYGHSMLGYNNLDASGFLALAFLYGYEWIRTKEYPYLLLSSILGGGYLWCRNGEPWWLSLLLFYAISLVIVKEMKWWKKGVLFVVCVIFLLTTKVVWEYSLQHWETLLQRQQASVALSENKENLPTKREEKAIAKEEFSLSTYGEQVVKIVGSVFTPLKYITLERVTRYLPLTIDMFWRAIVKPRLAYWWIVLLLMILFLSDGELRKRRELWTWPFFFWVNVAMIFVGTYVFIQTFPDWNIPGSAERMSMFLEPLVVFWSLPVITLCLEGRKA
ncbi:MAG: hypothetical protein N2314_08135 [Brevinematales bacterium]|nr:hypothetical protein [Brevinematales bacterium]